MGYTIVYDRLFLRCADRYIPFCLYGSSNCTQFSYKTGREIRERTWETFVYNDDMILGNAEKIMDIVKEHHLGDCQENFKYHGHWMDDAQVIKFFANGIKHAVTVEELRQQARESLDCYISAYIPDEDADTYPPSERWRHEHHEAILTSYPKTSEELIRWVESAKDEKARLLASGKARSVYITIRCDSEEPLNVIPREKLDEPCCLYAPGWGYAVKLSGDSASFAGKANWKGAQIFPNSDEAYLAADSYPNLGAVKLVPLSRLQKAAERNSVILSVQTSNGRQYIEKKTPRWLYYTKWQDRAKKFASEAAALKWYMERIHGKVKGASAPQAETLQSS